MEVYSNSVRNSPKMETTKCASTNEWLNKMWSLGSMEEYSAIKKEGKEQHVLIDSMTLMSLQKILLEARSLFKDVHVVGLHLYATVERT